MLLLILILALISPGFYLTEGGCFKMVNMAQFIIDFLSFKDPLGAAAV